MANPWGIAAPGLCFVVMGWLLSPILSFLVNKFFASLAVDTSRKLRELEIHAIPRLKLMLEDLEKQRMERPVKHSGSDLKTLEKIENDLKNAMYEAEDILDLVEYHRIERKVKGHRSWLQHLLGAAGACITRCKGSCWFVTRSEIILGGVLVQCAKGLGRLSATLRRSGDLLPIFQRASNPLVQRIRAWSQSLDIKPLCRSMQAWLAKTYVAACYYRDWSYEAIGIKTNEEDDIAADFFFRSIYGKSMKKRIEHIENIVNDSNKSHLLSQDRSSTEILVKDTNKENSSKKEKIDVHRSIKPEVFGRDKERQHICSMLRKSSDADGSSSSSSKPFSVIGIHGITGSGKSTLAKYVCDHEKEAEDKHFDLIMFSHVSTIFRVDKIFLDMLEQITQEKPSDTEDLRSLQKKFEEKLKEKRFLLVLDDLWVNNENEKGRDILLDALNAGKNGSIILVTAQREDAAAALGAQKQILIPDLEEKDYLSLFMHHSRPGAVGDDGTYKRIGTKIAKKLLFSPIAAVTVGKQLQRNTRISFWERTANDDVLNETMGALWWSYQQLGQDIRHCFAYCSIFPRAYKFERDQLVRIWIAQGFVNTRSDVTEELEDVGQNYFDELMMFSFLQVERDIFGTEEFTIHDLLHELAERVAGSYFHRIDFLGSPNDIPRGVHHVFIETNNGAEIAENYLELENLRTLIIKEHYYRDTDRMRRIEGKKRNHDLEKVFERLFTKLRKLRVLIVEGLISYNVVLHFSFPASIDQMRHLRYLGLHYNYGSTEVVLPSTFTELYHMQTIEVLPHHCSVSCSKDMSNLVHLKNISGCPFFPNVGSLTSLQTMKRFEVKKEQGYELKQLKHLNKLRGTLKIRCLGNVESKEEALEADLARKERLTKLELDFTGEPTSDPDVQAEVLEGLWPPKDIMDLRILSYKGSRYPSWMLSGQHPDALKRVHKLELWGCSRLASIPEDSGLFINLLDLRIMFCDWDSLPENMERLVSLQNLTINGCNRMELLPTLPGSLEMIQIIACRVLCTTCIEVGHQNWHRIKHISVTHITSDSSARTDEESLLAKVSIKSSQVRTDERDSSESLKWMGGPETEQDMMTTGPTSSVHKAESHEWVLDSGAWIHQTSNPQLLLEGGELQETAQDLQNGILGRGSLRAEGFEVPDVCYVEGDVRNVISVPKLSRDHGLVSVFESTHCHVKYRATGQIVGQGGLRNGVYVLDSLLIGRDGGGGGGGGGNERGPHEGGGGGGDGRGGHEGGGGGCGASGHGGGGKDSGGGGDRNGDKKINDDDHDDDREKEDDDEVEDDKEDQGIQGDPDEPSQAHARLFGLSRTMDRDPSGGLYCKLSAAAFPTSSNVGRREEFLVDSGAGFHTTWNENCLFPYSDELRNHTEPPILSFGGIGPGSVKVTRSGYLNNATIIMLHGVLLAPMAQANVVSVGQLTQQYWVALEMDHLGVTITDKSNGLKVGGAKMDEGHHYVLEYFHPGGDLLTHLLRRRPNIFGKSIFSRPPRQR